METDQTIAYQAEMQHAYGHKVRNLYNRAAADAFNEVYTPADPFNGVLVPAEFLAVSELAAVFKGAKALENEGNAAFASELIKWRDKETPLIRVSIPWLNSLRQRKYQICQYLQKRCWFDEVDSLQGASCELQIKYADDPQLDEYLKEAQKCLAIETEVINEV